MSFTSSSGMSAAHLEHIQNIRIMSEAFIHLAPRTRKTAVPVARIAKTRTMQVSSPRLKFRSSLLYSAELPDRITSLDPPHQKMSKITSPTN